MRTEANHHCDRKNLRKVTCTVYWVLKIGWDSSQHEPPPMSTPSLPSLLSLPAAPIFAHSSSPLPMVAISKSTNKHCPLLLFAHCLCPSLFSLQLVLLVAMLCKVLRMTWAESCWRQIVGFDCLFSVIVTLACSCVCLAAQGLCYLDTGHLEI